MSNIFVQPQQIIITGTAKDVRIALQQLLETFGENSMLTSFQTNTTKFKSN